MLVVSRIQGEQIVIGDPCNPIAIIHICSVRGERVRVGVEAERSVQIHRREVADQLAEEAMRKREAASADRT